MNYTQLKEILEEAFLKYNQPAFIEHDPVSIPHLFSKKEDIEISGFITAAIAWGQRKTILINAQKLFSWMDNSPHDFICSHSKAELKVFEKFVHRTFNGTDAVYFVSALKNIYLNNDDMETLFKKGIMPDDLNFANAINTLRKIFFSATHKARSRKHFADPLRNSSCKRLNMFLRWMVRKDNAGVDFGIWNISPAMLSCPLDIHSGRIARELGLLSRKQDDWKAVCELTEALKKFDANDPVKYDFALFGLGVNKGM